MIDLACYLGSRFIALASLTCRTVIPTNLNYEHSTSRMVEGSLVTLVSERLVYCVGTRKSRGFSADYSHISETSANNILYTTTNILYILHASTLHAHKQHPSHNNILYILHASTLHATTSRNILHAKTSSNTHNILEHVTISFTQSDGAAEDCRGT